jgi:hypothetical protein
MSFNNSGIEREEIPFANDSVSHGEIMLNAINHFGWELQFNHAIQEMAELTKEITEYIGREKLNHKKLNKVEIADEIADVEIMLEQVKMILGNHSEVTVRKIFKLKRLQERLEKKE